MIKWWVDATTPLVKRKNPEVKKTHLCTVEKHVTRLQGETFSHIQSRFYHIQARNMKNRNEELATVNLSCSHYRNEEIAVIYLNTDSKIQ